MEKDIKDYFKEAFDIRAVDPKGYSPLALAYLGDAVYELMIRTILVSRKDMQVQKYHKKASQLVKAETQANMIHALQEHLTEEELAVYKRGRNAKSYTMAKNATVSDYRAATGFEALIGYLYLKDELERAVALVRIALEAVNEKKEESEELAEKAKQEETAKEAEKARQDEIAKKAEKTKNAEHAEKAEE